MLIFITVCKLYGTLAWEIFTGEYFSSMRVKCKIKSHQQKCSPTPINLWGAWSEENINKWGMKSFLGICAILHIPSFGTILIIVYFEHITSLYRSAYRLYLLFSLPAGNPSGSIKYTQWCESLCRLGIFCSHLPRHHQESWVFSLLLLE